MTQPRTSSDAVAAGTVSLAAYLYAQQQITKRMLAVASSAFSRWGVPDTPAQVTQMAQRIYPVVQQARAQSYSIATRHMQSEMNRTRQSVAIAPQRNYPQQAVVKVIDKAVSKADASTQPRVAVVVRETGAVLARHADLAGRDAVHDTADRGGEQVGWARVLSGAENCSWCAMLASRGPVYRSEQSATQTMYSIGNEPRGGGQSYHDHCDCRAVLVFKGRSWEGEDQYLALDQLWRDTTGKQSGWGKAKAFRRAYERPHLHLEPDNPWLANLPAPEAG